MTDFSILAELDTTLDVESLREKCMAERGLDLLGIYDLHTGRLIGQLDPDELDFAAEEIDADSEDDLLNGLIERVIGAMRPSICLNRPDRLTIQNLMVKRPVDCMAFLVNRLNSNRKTLVERGRHSIAPLLDRIMTYRQLCHLADAGVDFTPWIHWLLELDSKCNLHDIDAPRFALDRLNRWTRVREGVSIFGLLDEHNHKDLLKVFESWVFEMVGKYDERDRQLTREAQWMRGNTHSQPAYVRSWLDNPQIASRKHAAELKKTKDSKTSNVVKPAKPGRPVAEKTQQALSVLEAILQGKLSSKPATPVAKPASPILKPALAGLLKNLKKES